jgi:hypothetical protein
MDGGTTLNYYQFKKCLHQVAKIYISLKKMLSSCSIHIYLFQAYLRRSFLLPIYMDMKRQIKVFFNVYVMYIEII